MSKRSKACDISPKVKKKYGKEITIVVLYVEVLMQCQMLIILVEHKGGLGIEQNIVTLCMRCHNDYDNGNSRVSTGYKIQWYLKSCYDNWNEKDLIYKRRMKNGIKR